MEQKLNIKTAISEKISIANKIYNTLYKRAYARLQYKINKIAKLSDYHFPYYFTGEYKTENYGVWFVILTICNRPKHSFNNCDICFDAYQIYHITNARNSENNGRGIFNITCGSDLIPRFIEIAPHLLNRMQERSSKEIFEMSDEEVCRFYKKETMNSIIVMPKQTERIINNIPVRDGIANIKNGQLLGTSFDNAKYICWKTYISINEMKDSQVAMNNINDSLYDFEISKMHPYIYNFLYNNILETLGNNIKELYNGNKEARYSEDVRKYA